MKTLHFPIEILNGYSDFFQLDFFVWAEIVNPMPNLPHLCRLGTNRNRKAASSGVAFMRITLIISIDITIL